MAAASHGATISGASMVVVTCFSAVSLATGIAHYRGWRRGVWLRLLPFEATYFLPAWIGACGLLLVLDLLLGRVSTLAEAIVGVPTCVVFAIMLLSIVWLPRRLLPTWFVAWREHGRPQSELVR